VPLVIYTILRFFPDNENDEWNVFPTQDGDTLWNAKADNEDDPVYVQKVMEFLRTRVLEHDDTIAFRNQQAYEKAADTTQSAPKASRKEQQKMIPKEKQEKRKKISRSATPKSAQGLDLCMILICGFYHLSNDSFGA